MTGEGVVVIGEQPRGGGGRKPGPELIDEPRGLRAGVASHRVIVQTNLTGTVSLKSGSHTCRPSGTSSAIPAATAAVGPDCPP